MKLKVGDKVRVIDKGRQYTSYKDFIKNNLLERLNDFKYGDEVSSDKKYKVVFIENIGYSNRNACIIEDLNTNQIFIIDEIGVEIVKEEKRMSKCKVYEMPEYVRNEVKKVIINEPCVVVILNTGEKGVAKCCPEDKFSEAIGFNIAFNRARIKKCENNAKSYEELINTISKFAPITYGEY